MCTTLSWGDLVEAGRVELQNESWARFALGDLAIEAHRRGRLPQYAGEVHIEVSTLDHYRRVALAWPSEQRIEGTSWSAHRALMAHPRRFQLLRQLGPKATVAKVRAAAGRFRAVTPDEAADPVSLYRELAAPGVAEVVGALDDDGRLAGGLRRGRKRVAASTGGLSVPLDDLVRWFVANGQAAFVDTLLMGERIEDPSRSLHILRVVRRQLVKAAEAAPELPPNARGAARREIARLRELLIQVDKQLEGTPLVVGAERFLRDA